MFSYRHAFHAGNHADVLKHLVLLATLRHLMQKSTPLVLIDTHAGAGIYRLDGDMAGKSGESDQGVTQLWMRYSNPGGMLAPALADYLDLVRAFNAADGPPRVYPGSPLLLYHLMDAPERAGVRDRLKLFDLHPTDSRLLLEHVKQLRAGQRVTVERSDGFEVLKRLLPPPAAEGSRRALVLIDPSYEIKTDYARVSAAVADALKRFATGVYCVWYPIIPRMAAHGLPRRLKTLARGAQRPWLHATLAVGEAPPSADSGVRSDGKPRHPLSASGVFLINPPHTLEQRLRAALPQALAALGQGVGQRWSVECGR